MKQATQVCVMVLLTALLVSCISARSLTGYERSRTRRATSDQRMAELQALIALSRDGVGHGMFNPLEIGKKKRSEGFEGYGDNDMSQSQLIQKFLQSLHSDSNL